MLLSTRTGSSALRVVAYAMEEPTVAAGPAHAEPTYSRGRHAAAAAFSLGNAMNAVLWICFSPVAAATARRYAVSIGDVNQLSLLYLYLYAPGCLLSGYVMQRYGLRANVAMGAVLNTACGWLRFAATARGAGFGLLAVGQAFGALAQPAFLNAPARLAADWFPAREREHVIVWTAVSNIIGNAIGSAVPGLAVSKTSEGRNLDDSLLYQAVACTGLLALTLASLARPLGSTAVAVQSARVSDASALRNVLRDALLLLRNGNYMSLCVAFAIGIGLFNALLTLVAQLLSPCGYGPDVASYTGGALLVTGLITAGLAGVCMTRAPHAAVLLQKALVLLLLMALVGMLACLRRGALAPLVVTWGALGGALIPLLPVSLENAAAVAHPVSPDAAAGVMLLAGQFAGIAYIYAIPPLLALPRSANCSSVASPAAAFLLANMLVAVAVISLLKYDDRRLKEQDDQQPAAELADAAAA